MSKMNFEQFVPNRSFDDALIELESYTIDKSKPYLPINLPLPNYKTLKTSGK